MCRNIKTLFNFEPSATEAEIRDASLQFVRKICGFTSPSKANELAFEPAVKKLRHQPEHLFGRWSPRRSHNREVETEKLRARSRREVRAEAMRFRSSIDHLGQIWPRCSRGRRHFSVEARPIGLAGVSPRCEVPSSRRARTRPNWRHPAWSPNSLRTRTRSHLPSGLRKSSRQLIGAAQWRPSRLSSHQ